MVVNWYWIGITVEVVAGLIGLYGVWKKKDTRIIMYPMMVIGLLIAMGSL